MSGVFCKHCGTVTGKGERKCMTAAEVAKCPWMQGVHREVIVQPYAPIKTPKQD